MVCTDVCCNVHCVMLCNKLTESSWSGRGVTQYKFGKKYIINILALKLPERIKDFFAFLSMVQASALSGQGGLCPYII